MNFDDILSAIDHITGAPERNQTQRTRPVKRRHPRHGQMHTLTVQKPFCAPCRDRLLTFMYMADEKGRPLDGDWRYGVGMYNPRERVATTSIKDAAKLLRIELRDKENLKYGPMALAFMPTAWQATFEVKVQHAKWAEYMCERNGLAVVSGSVDAKARQNADKWNRKPIPRGDGKAPLIEETCAEGMELWRALQRGEKPPNISDELMQELTQPRR